MTHQQKEQITAPVSYTHLDVYKRQIFNTRQGPGQPILYLSLYSGRPRLMLYNSSGSLILDESVTPPFSLVNNGWYFLAAVIEPDAYKACYVVGDRSTGTAVSYTHLDVYKRQISGCTG